MLKTWLKSGQSESISKKQNKAETMAENVLYTGDKNGSVPTSDPLNSNDLEEPPFDGDMSDPRKRARHNTGVVGKDDTITGCMNDIMSNVDELRSESGELSSQVQTLSLDATGMAKQIELLTNVIIKQDKVIDNLQNGFIDMQKRSMQNNIVIHNAKERNDENCKQVAVNAINAKGIKAQYEIERAHRTGMKRKPGENPRPLIVRLTRQDHAYNVIQAARPDKGKRPNKGDIKITPQNPDRTRYERSKMGEFAFLYRERNKNSKKDIKISVKNDHIIADGKKIADEVKAPNAEAILAQSAEEEENCRKITFHETELKCEQGSKFKLYAAEIKSINDAKLAYIITYPSNVLSSLQPLPISSLLIGHQTMSKVGKMTVTTEWADSCTIQ
jgi:hypothetical protein